MWQQIPYDHAFDIHPDEIAGMFSDYGFAGIHGDMDGWHNQSNPAVATKTSHWVSAIIRNVNKSVVVFHVTYQKIQVTLRVQPDYMGVELGCLYFRIRGHEIYTTKEFAFAEQTVKWLVCANDNSSWVEERDEEFVLSGKLAMKGFMVPQVSYKEFADLDTRLKSVYDHGGIPYMISNGKIMRL